MFDGHLEEERERWKVANDSAWWRSSQITAAVIASVGGKKVSPADVNPNYDGPKRGGRGGGIRLTKGAIGAFVDAMAARKKGNR